MAKITGNEPVMPDPMRGTPKNNSPYQSHELPTGLTIRQHFAAMAMQGLCANPMSPEKGVTPHEIAATAIAMADALIAQLNTPQ